MTNPCGSPEHVAQVTVSPQSAEYSELPGTLRRYPGAHQSVTCETTEQGLTQSASSQICRCRTVLCHVYVCMCTVAELRCIYTVIVRS